MRVVFVLLLKSLMARVYFSLSSITSTSSYPTLYAQGGRIVWVSSLSLISMSSSRDELLSQHWDGWHSGASRKIKGEWWMPRLEKAMKDAA